MTTQEAQDLKVGDRIVWSSPHPRAPRVTGTIVRRSPRALTIAWDDADWYPVMDLDDCARLERDA